MIYLVNFGTFAIKFVVEGITDDCAFEEMTVKLEKRGLHIRDFLAHVLKRKYVFIGVAVFLVSIFIF